MRVPGEFRGHHTELLTTGSAVSTVLRWLGSLRVVALAFPYAYYAEGETVGSRRFSVMMTIRLLSGFSGRVVPQLAHDVEIWAYCPDA